MKRFLAAIVLRTLRQIFTTLIVLSASAYMSGSRGADGIRGLAGQIQVRHHVSASADTARLPAHTSDKDK